MVDRLLKPALEMRETQEKYEFSLTLRFVLAFVNMDYDLMVLICASFLYIGS